MHTPDKASLFREIGRFSQIDSCLIDWVLIAAIFRSHIAHTEYIIFKSYKRINIIRKMEKNVLDRFTYHLLVQ